MSLGRYLRTVLLWLAMVFVVVWVLSPFAWAIGGKAVREIDANPTMYGGRSAASAGKVMGIIGTILLILGIVAIIAIIAIVVASDSSTTYDSGY